jgi:adenosylmethionine-8-amino-7-oxononanoate aminotransferase
MTQHAVAKRPRVIVEAHGCTVVDTDGREYFDAISGIWCVNVGYGQEQLVDAAAAQMRRLPFTPLTRPAPVTLELAERLRQLLPGDLNHILFVNTGSEATEAALKIARQYARQRYPRQNRHKVIARYRGYHGWTSGANSASGQAGRKVAFEPLAQGFLHVRPPDLFHLFPGISGRDVAHELARELRQVIESEGPETIAAFIGEPVIGGGGVIVPPDDYWPLVRRVCDDYGVLLIHDEVITGFGRTGTMFGSHHWGIVADLVTLAKGMASGYMPIGAVGVSDEVFDAFLGAPEDNVQFSQISTFAGHPVACAVALANLDVLEEQRLVENAAARGTQLIEGARSLQQRYAVVGDVRGKGLMCAIEFVTPDTREPLPRETVGSLISRIEEQGVLVGRSAGTVPRLESLVMLAPPLVATAAEIDHLLAVIDRTLRALTV